jgi:hypothetical protein
VVNGVRRGITPAAAPLEEACVERVVLGRVAPPLRVPAPTFLVVAPGVNHAEVLDVVGSPPGRWLLTLQACLALVFGRIVRIRPGTGKNVVEKRKQGLADGYATGYTLDSSENGMREPPANRAVSDRQTGPASLPLRR